MKASTFRHPKGTPLSALYFFLLICVCICFDRVLLGPYAATIFPDALDDMTHIASRASLLLKHGLTAWNPLAPGGMPSGAATFPSYSFPCLLSTFLPLWVINHLWNILALFMFSYGAYRAGSEYFGISRRSALLASVFCLAPFLGSNPQIFFMFSFPLFFVWTHDLCKDGLSLRKRLCLVIGLLCMTATSYPVLSLPLYPAYHLFLYLIFCRERPRLARNVSAIFIVWTGYVLFFTPSITTLLGYVPFSQRDVVGGTATLGQAALNLLGEIRGSLRVDNVLAPLLLTLCLAFRNVTARRLLLFTVSFLLLGALFRSDFRLLFAGTVFTKLDLRLAGTMVAFPLTLCIGLIIDRLGKGLTGVPWYWWLLTLGTVVLVLRNEARIIRNVLILAEIVLGAMLLASATAGALAARPGRRTKLVIAGLCGCLALSLMLGKQSALVFGQARIAQVVDNHPELRALKQESEAGPFRVGSLDLHPAISTSYGLETVDGRGPLFNRHFKENIGLAIAPQLKNPEVARVFKGFWYALTLNPSTSENYPRYDQTFGIAPHTAADLNIPMLQAMNVQYLLAGHPVEGLEADATLAFVAKGEGLPGPWRNTRLNQWYELPIYGYRLNQTLPRGRLITRTLSFADKDQAQTALGMLTLEERRATAVLLDADRGDLPVLSGGEAGTATLRSYAPDTLEYACETNSPCYLLVANNYDPSWRAVVDGAPAHVIRADNAFQAVFLAQPGKHLVTLAFRPPLQTAGYAAALLGLAMICSLVLLGRKSGHSPGLPLPQAGESLAFLPRDGWVAGTLGAGAAAVFWAIGFALFILPRFPYPHEPIHYALVVIPGAGVLVALALCRALAKR